MGLLISKEVDNVVHRWDGEDDNGFHGIFYVGPVTASLPAVRWGLERPGVDDNSVHPVLGQGRPRFSRR